MKILAIYVCNLPWSLAQILLFWAESGAVWISLVYKSGHHLFIAFVLRHQHSLFQSSYLNRSFISRKCVNQSFENLFLLLNLKKDPSKRRTIFSLIKWSFNAKCHIWWQGWTGGQSCAQNSALNTFCSVFDNFGTPPILLIPYLLHHDYLALSTWHTKIEKWECMQKVAANLKWYSNLFYQYHLRTIMRKIKKIWPLVDDELFVNSRSWWSRVYNNYISSTKSL